MTSFAIILNTTQANSIASFANMTAPKTDAPILQHAKLSIKADNQYVSVIATDRYALARTIFEPAYIETPATEDIEILLSADTLKLFKTKSNLTLTYDTDTNQLAITSDNSTSTFTPLSPIGYPDIVPMLETALSQEPIATPTFSLNLAFINRISKLQSSLDTRKTDPKFDIKTTGDKKPIIFKRANLTVLLQPLRTSAN